jgi:hypothetical protein
MAALAWHGRGSRFQGGVAVGLAIALKFFAWPIALWLAATRRWLGVAIAVSLGVASFVSVAPFTGLDEYTQALVRLGRHFDQDSYTTFGLLAQIGVPDGAARAATFVFGGALAIGTWRHRSFTLAIATALVLSPIVWLDYFALMAIPLAISRPRLSFAWILPIATWGAPGTGIGIGDPVDITRVLVVFAIVAAISLRAELGSQATETSRGSSRTLVTRRASPI